MVHSVLSPKERDTVIPTMEPIVGKINDKDPCNNFQPVRDCYPIKQAKLIGFNPFKSLEGHIYDNRSKGNQDELEQEIVKHVFQLATDLRATAANDLQKE